MSTCLALPHHSKQGTLRLRRRDVGKRGNERRHRAVNSWRRFLFVVALVCGGSYVAIYWFGISPGYCSYSRSYADLAPCYKYDVRGVSTDVVLVGDSAVLYGIRPSIVEQASHISTYNYGLVGPAFTFDPQAVIDHYLVTNARPRAIVVYFSPWSRFDLHKITDPQWFPIAVLTLRHGTWVDFFDLFLARPSAIVEIPPTIVRSTGLSSASAKERREEMERDRGHFDYSATLGGDHFALADDCRPANRSPDATYAADNRAALAALRSHYAAIGMPLFVYVAPTAVCDGEIDSVRNVYDGVADNRPIALPNRFFANDTPSARHSHVNADGVGPASEILADFLAHKLELHENSGR
jgi:hypothetical protein